MEYKTHKVKTQPAKAKKKKAKGQRTLIVALSSIAVLLSSVLVVLLLLPPNTAGAISSASSRAPFAMRTVAVEEKDTSEQFIKDHPEYEGTILMKTADAGQKYLDDTLFIGDSNTERLYMFGLMPLVNVMGVVGMGIQSATNHPGIYWYGYDNPVTIPKAVTMTQPRRIVISFGTNNLLNKDPDWFIECYGDMIDALEKAYKYAEIIIMTVPPISATCPDKTLSNKTVKEYNDALLEFAKERGLRYLNVYEDLLLDKKTGAIKNEYIDLSDGIHLSRTACQKILDYVKTHATDTKDSRPKPLNTIPSRKPAPPPPPVEKPKFSASTAAGYVASNLLNSGFKAPSGKVDYNKAINTMSYTYADADVKPGMELQVSETIISAVKGSHSSGIISVAGYYDEDAKVHVITVYFFKNESSKPPEVTTPEVTTPEVTTPEVTTPEVTDPEVTPPDA